MNAILKGKIFGMPRWLFFILLAVGLAIGIYLRRRNTTAPTDTTGTLDNTPAADASSDSPIGSYADDPGLAGVGIATQPAGAVTPVSTPFLPEGITDIIGSLTGTISDIATGVGATPPNAVDQPVAVAPPPGNPTTGGGPPNRVPHTVARPRVPRAEAIRRVHAIQARHGARSPEARRAATRLGIQLPKPPARKRRR